MLFRCLSIFFLLLTEASQSSGLFEPAKMRAFPEKPEICRVTTLDSLNIDRFGKPGQERFEVARVDAIEAQLPGDQVLRSWVISHVLNDGGRSEVKASWVKSPKDKKPIFKFDVKVPGPYDLETLERLYDMGKEAQLSFEFQSCTPLELQVLYYLINEWFLFG